MTEVKLSVSIMAHRKRAHLVTRLVKNLGLTMDHVVWDQLNDRWDTGRRSMLAYDPDATHHLVIQDDALPARDLLSSIEAWAPYLPEAVLCLYAGRVREFREKLSEVNPPQPSWLQMKKINWGVALVFPVEHIRPMVAYGDGRVEMGNYDMRLSEYCVLNDLPVLYPYPSWVNHATTPSLVPGRSGTRKAVAALGSRESALRWRKFDVPIIPVPDFVRLSEMDYPLLSQGL